ncbi:hypothetical protein [uncultured Parvimonas sp.]|uniref:hypothetical protein n=1 Tax=uncultured Parvimonas sp. TaxID=747372 RepID=UPI0028D64394|nr:hypothetical protein [uncultured Parvimonas sp.]
MKKRFLIALMSCCLLFNNINVTKAEDNNLNDNYRIYELFNISDTKNLELTGESTIDFSNTNKNENKLEGIYKADYTLRSTNNGNSTLKMGITFNSSIENLSKFSLKMDGAEIPYSFKFLNDKFKSPTGTEFYKEIIGNIDSPIYEPVNFKKEDVGVLRKFNLESSNTENLKYEITIKYSTDKTKLFLSGGEDLKVEENKSNKTLILTHELSGKSKTPILYTIGSDVNITTKVYSGDKEINSGYKENIDKTSVNVENFLKNIFLGEIPENVRQRFSEDNLYEIFAENFDKIIGGSGYDSLGVLKSTADKQIVVTFETTIEPKVEKKLSVEYPISSTLTTINNINVMKLNIESSPFSTFDNFESFKYTFKGNEDYKYIISSNTKYTNTKNGSEITLSKAPIEIITNLVYKERYVKGISEKESKSYTKLVIIILGISEVVGVLYLKNVYFKDKKSNKRKR